MSFSEVTEPLWGSFYERMEEDFAEGYPTDWRHHPVVNSACEFAALDVLTDEAQYLVGRYPDFDRLVSANPPTSIHHLYHLTRWTDHTGIPFESLDRVVEWGGGYGSLARLLLLLNPRIEYVVIDQPPMLRLLGHFLPDSRVTRVPVEDADTVRSGCDLFVSTWALSESGVEAQDYVSRRKWFEARHLLMAFADSGFAGSDHFKQLVHHLPKVPALTPESQYILT